MQGLWPRVVFWRKDSYEQLTANIHSSRGMSAPVLKKKIWIDTDTTMIAPVPGEDIPQGQCFCSFVCEGLSGPSGLSGSLPSP